MTKDLSALSALRVDAVPLNAVLRSREEFTGGERPEIVLAFDQSFAATGWALMRFGHGDIDVMLAGTIKTSSTLTGALEDLDRAEQLAMAIKDTFYDPRAAQAMTKVVYEQPLKGGAIRNPEVALMAALALRLAFRFAMPTVEPTPVTTKAWKKMATGNANLKDKRQAHNAVAGWPFVENFKTATNESQRDAVMVGLASQWKGA